MLCSSGLLRHQPHRSEHHLRQIVARLLLQSRLAVRKDYSQLPSSPARPTARSAAWPSASASPPPSHCHCHCHCHCIASFPSSAAELHLLHRSTFRLQTCPTSLSP